MWQEREALGDAVEKQYLVGAAIVVGGNGSADVGIELRRRIRGKFSEGRGKRVLQPLRCGAVNVDGKVQVSAMGGLIAVIAQRVV